jgi:hypothetical protein
MPRPPPLPPSGSARGTASKVHGTLSLHSRLPPPAELPLARSQPCHSAWHPGRAQNRQHGTRPVWTDAGWAEKRKKKKSMSAAQIGTCRQQQQNGFFPHGGEPMTFPSCVLLEWERKNDNQCQAGFPGLVESRPGPASVHQASANSSLGSISKLLGVEKRAGRPVGRPAAPHTRTADRESHRKGAQLQNAHVEHFTWAGR